MRTCDDNNANVFPPCKLKTRRAFGMIIIFRGEGAPVLRYGKDGDLRVSRPVLLFSAGYDIAPSP